MSQTSILSNIGFSTPLNPNNIPTFKKKIQPIHKQIAYNARMTRGERIIQLRSAKNWSRVDLSTASGVGYDRLNKIETGKTKEPRGTTLQSIAEALGVSVHYLNTGEEDVRSCENEPVTNGIASQAMDADQLHQFLESTKTEHGSSVTEQAWKLAEDVEERVFGKGKGDMAFLLQTYELIYKRLISNKAENE